MATELWQRLRAARKAADLRQEDIARATGVSRGAVAQWESARAENRSIPSLAQVSVVADITGFPVAMLLDEKADDADFALRRLSDRHRFHPGDGRQARKEVTSGPTIELFTQAVRFAIASLPHLADGMRDAEVLTQFSALNLPLIHLTPTAAVALVSPDRATDGIAALFMAHADRPKANRSLELLVWIPGQSREESQILSDAAFPRCGITVVRVSDPKEVAEYIDLCNAA